MTAVTAIGLFVACLLLATASSAVLSHRLDQGGTHLGLSEGLLGLLTALAADSPEISTSVTRWARSCICPTRSWARWCWRR